jgi:hypothetical protein
VISTGTGLWRCSFTTASYPAAGTATYSDLQKLNFGAVPAAEIEAVIRSSVPPGTTITTYVSASLTSVANWTAITDGTLLSALSTAIANASMYAMKATFASTTSLDVTPVLWEMGLRSRTLTDLTEYCTVGPATESVNPLTGEVLLGECEVRVLRHGDRDFQGIERLLSETSFAGIELRTYIGHEDLARGDWLYLDTWRVDDYEVTETDVRLTAVSILERLKGRYPVAAVGPVAYIVSTSTSTLVGGSYNLLFSNVSGTAANVTIILAAAATSTMGFAFTPAGVPALSRWPVGTFTVQVNVTGTASGAAVAVLISRVGAVGTVVATGVTTEFQSCQATGIKTFTVANVAVTAFAIGTSTDRLRVAVVVTNVNATGTCSLTLQINNANSLVTAPWTPVVERTPVNVDATTPQAAWNTWITTVGLSERYKGDPPPNVTDLISKQIMDADGKRELERIAFVAGGMPIASQGRVTFAPLQVPNGTVAATFPWESYTPVRVDPGFRARIPTLFVPFQYDGGKFRGEVKVVHAAALSAYGVSRIDNPDQRVEDETAKYFRDMALAGIVGQDLVSAAGAGMMTVTLRPSFRHPELELGDTVAVETDLFALKDPVTSDAIRGYVWAVGRIIARTGPWNDELVVWIRGVSDLQAPTATAERRTPYEGPAAIPTVTQDPAALANALVRVRPYPPTATVYYVYYAATADPPKPDDITSWAVYSTVVTVARNATADMLFSAFAVEHGFAGAIRTVRVSPDATASIGSLSGSESGATPTITVEAVWSNLSANTRYVDVYMRKHATDYPTATGTSTGDLSVTYFIARLPVDGNSSGYDYQGNILGYAVRQADLRNGATYATASHCQMIAVPIDYNFNPGTRKTLAYTVAGAASARLTTATWTVNATGTAYSTSRSYDFAWTPSGVSDVTHDLNIYLTLNGVRTLLKSEVSPNSVTAETAQEIGYCPKLGDPDIVVSFDYELVAGASVVDSGTFSPLAGETFQGRATV